MGASLLGARYPKKISAGSQFILPTGYTHYSCELNAPFKVGIDLQYRWCSYTRRVRPTGAAPQRGAIERQQARMGTVDLGAGLSTAVCIIFLWFKQRH